MHMHWLDGVSAPHFVSKYSENSPINELQYSKIYHNVLMLTQQDNHYAPMHKAMAFVYFVLQTDLTAVARHRLTVKRRTHVSQTKADMHACAESQWQHGWQDLLLLHIR